MASFLQLTEEPFLTKFSSPKNFGWINFVINYSLSCRSKPVRPAFIFRTQIKIFLAFWPCIDSNATNYSRSFIKLRLKHWCHIDCFNDLLTTFLGLKRGSCVAVVQGQKALEFHQKYLNLCSEDYFFIFGRTNPLSFQTSKKVQKHHRSIIDVVIL